MDTQRFVITMNGDNISFIVGDNAINHLSEEAGKYDSIVIMISKTVEEMYANHIPDVGSFGNSVVKISLNDGESLKSLRNYQKIVKVLLERKVDRRSLLVYIGGGTVGDLAGFVASTYKRGVMMIAVPTTLLAQVDSSIGGKNGLDFSDVKNVIGTFYNPYMVIDDTVFLKNNSFIIREGMSEVIKYAIISGGDMYDTLNRCSIDNFDACATNIIKLSVKIKSEIVNRDFYDRTGIRSVLNLGHTIAHGIEGATKGSISHGKAVATGMLVEAHIGEKYGNTNHEVIEAIRDLMKRYGIEELNLKEIGPGNILRYISNDKKIMEGYINMPVPSEIGKVITMKATERMISDGINTFIKENDAS
ncbi:3-dehydroquinate synthase [Thermoplasma volcanium GSS1]|uniref:3-dehydroquinate synthase n=1 Tax=Thermoplasma volcanium (strain ATCC 51530 / DSM 4299 / JCM 9571 / NBRC 15438 / GSS1) TaxID=273116 RepID=AROB_THEVO|nr:3-dehydroquinate synthase [Thermoplasma volcanium]Q978S6.1 RecName: Full=3-dehydroquinate synthase; Short=DHQS [Thermoplasma volcanium GSS1]BAB60481.1 3-dehydroquinate synthase [Thermoplasma volcanium GSS1]